MSTSIITDDNGSEGEKSENSLSGSGPMPADFERWLRRRSQSGNWFVVFDDYLEVMSIEAAWVFQRILNLGKHRPKKPADRKLWEQGWIKVSVTFLERRTKLKKPAQRRVLDELRGATKIEGGTRKKGGRPARMIDARRAFVKVKLFGLPAQRYVKVDLVKVERAIDTVKADQQRPSGLNPVSSRRLQTLPSIEGNEHYLPEGNESNPNKRNGRKRNDKTPARLRRDGRVNDPNGDGSSSTPGDASAAPNGKHHAAPKGKRSAVVGSPLFASNQPDPTPRASRLYAAVRNKLTGSHRMKDWEKWFARLESELAAGEFSPRAAASEVDRMLDGYLRHFAERTKYLPEIFCGRTFYEKRDALRRFLAKHPDRPEPGDPTHGGRMVWSEDGKSCRLVVDRGEDD